MLTPATAPTVGYLSRCQQQAVYARRFLEDEDLRQCLTLLYWPADALITLIDADATVPDSDKALENTSRHTPAGIEAAHEPARNDARADQVTDVVSYQLDAADQYYQHFTQRTVRSAYFRGIGYGMIVVILLSVILYVFRRTLNVPIPLLWSAVAGALGALTSVLSSATFGRIVLDRTQGGTWNSYLGAFRPIIGALFGLAFFALINAGFLPIRIPSGGGEIALYASVAFLAGFSHRWAQDTLKSAEGRISASPTPASVSPEQEPAIKATRQKA